LPMASTAERMATGLLKHDNVIRVRVVDDDCVEVRRKSGYRTVTVRVVDTRVEAADLDTLGLDDVDAIVTVQRDAPYEWEAKVEAQHRGRDLYTNREFWSALNNRQFVGNESTEVEYFRNRIGAHDKVVELESIGQKLFRVHRSSGLRPLVVYCADEYIVSEDFVQRVVDEYPEVQFITNLSSWNRITPEAAAEARRHGCQVCDLSGIYGALNRNARTVSPR
jgi:hypothetical protein